MDIAPRIDPDQAGRCDVNLNPPRNANERLDWLRLTRSENVGPATFFSLLSRFGSAAAALEAVPALARRGGASRQPRVMSVADGTREMAALEAVGARLIAQGEAEYPLRLAAIDSAPPMITVSGDSSLLARDQLAMVGGRNASAAGVRLARELASALGQSGLVITSGLARGIDAAAHQGALETGTVGVIAGGIDNVYPSENRTLYDALKSRGLIVTEMPFGTAPQARHFPRRNRIISGLALAVLVVEAAERSGSLITARFALEQGRDVLAVPGSPLDPRARGANRLIQSGATLVQGAEDVLDALGPLQQASNVLRDPVRSHLPYEDVAALDDAAIEAVRRQLTALISPVPVEVDELVRQTGQPPALVQAALLELELAGRVTRVSGQRVCVSVSE